MRKTILIFIIVFAAVSCSYFKKPETPEAVARVNQSVLLLPELMSLIPDGLSEADSAALAQSFIDRWATQRLLLDAAQRNLSSDQLAQLLKLVEDYKSDLLTKAYLEKIVSSQMDTLVTDSQLMEYYDSNKENLRTTGMLVQLRYLQLPLDHPELNSIKKRFSEGFPKSQKDKAKEFWDRVKLQSKGAALNDSVWVEMNQIYRRLPFITPDNRDGFMVSGKSFEYKDSTDIYLVKVKKVIDKNQVAPFAYIRPTIKLVLLNQRKLDYMQRFEREILEDAKKQNTYEIFQP